MRGKTLLASRALLARSEDISMEPEKTVEQEEPNTITVKDERRTEIFTDRDIKRYINAVTHYLHDLPYDSPREDIHNQKFEFGAICWWLGNCEFLQFLDTLPDIPVLSKEKTGAIPDIFAIFSREGRSFPCFIVIAEFDRAGELTIYSKYIERVRKYHLTGDVPVLVAAKYGDEWNLIDLEDRHEDSGRIRLSHGEAARANVMGALCGDARFRGLRKDTSWYYIIETEEDLELIKQNIVPLRDPVTEITLESRDGEKVGFTPILMDLLPFFGTWKRFEDFREDLVISGAVLAESRPLHLYQMLVFSALFGSQLEGRDGVDWRAILRENALPFSVEDARRALRYGAENSLGFEGFENCLPTVDLPQWLTDRP